MLRDFGIVTVVDLTVSLLGVLAVLPAVLVLAERRAERAREPGPGVALGRPGVSDTDPPGPFGVRERGEEPPQRTAPRAGWPHPQPPARRSTVTWIVGVVVVFAIAYITLNTIRTDAPGSRGVEPGERAAAVRGAARALGPRRRREPRDEARPGRPGRPARLRGARAGRAQLVRAGRARAGRARVLRRAARSAATGRSTRSSACARTTPTSRSPRWRSAATATSCGARSASTAGSCRWPATATAPSPTPTPSRSARRSRSPTRAAACRARRCRRSTGRRCARRLDQLRKGP